MIAVNYRDGLRGSITVQQAEAEPEGERLFSRPPRPPSDKLMRLLSDAARMQREARPATKKGETNG